MLGPSQCLCTQCDKLGIHQLTFAASNLERVNLDIPDFIADLLEHDIEKAKAEKKAEDKKSGRSYRDKDDVPVSFEKLRNAPDIDECKEGPTEAVQAHCGLPKEALRRVVEHVNQKHDGDPSMSKLSINDLFMACSIWRQNLSYRFAAAEFGYRSHSGIQNVVDRVIDLLIAYWVPDWIGSGYWGGKDLSEHVPDFVRRLWPEDNVVAIADATYLYTQKSQRNYQYQKCTYSVYKHRNLLKEHVVCSAQGKIFFVDGPFYADGQNSDQYIWDWIVHNTDHDIHRIFPCDALDQIRKYTIVADRGYRRCLDNAKYPLIIPFGVTTENVEVADEDGGEKKTKAKKKNLTAEEANYSKFCSSCALCR